MSAVATHAQGRVKGQRFKTTSSPHARKLTISGRLENDQRVGACSDPFICFIIYFTANNSYFPSFLPELSYEQARN